MNLPFLKRSLLFVLAICFHLSVECQTTNKPVATTQPLPATTVDPRPADYPVGVKVNYVRTWEPLEPISDISAIGNYQFNPALPNNKVKQYTVFYDGLGRELQSVERMGATNGLAGDGLYKDVVSPVVYDQFGRITHQYLPYNAPDNGNFKINPFLSQEQFFSNTNINQGLSGEQALYKKIVYEASPLNRVEKIFAPGNSWAGTENTANPAQEKAIRIQYQTNNQNDLIPIWSIFNNPLTFTNNDVTVNIPSTASTYLVGQLYKNVSIDENGSAVVEYITKEGLMILKKVQIGNSVPADFSGFTNWLCTFYIYDDLNQLRFVIPPKAVTAIQSDWVLPADVINELCYRYEYDERKRLFAKKLPGAGWNYTIYDQRNRPVFSQDAKMRLSNKWMATVYDQLNRTVMTGLITYSGTPAALKSYVNGQNIANDYTLDGKTSLPASLYVSERISGTSSYEATQEVTFTSGFESETNGAFTASIVPNAISGNNIVVNSIPFPAGHGFVALTITYYDNYEWNSGGNKQFSSADNSKLNNVTLDRYLDPVPNAKSILTTGMVTGIKVRVLDNLSNPELGRWLTTVHYYDNNGRTIQSQSDNQKGGIDIVTTRYDFTDLANITYEVHHNPAENNERVRVRTIYAYDQNNDLLSVKKQLNDNGSDKVISAMSYDSQGDLQRKLLGGSTVGSAIQATDFKHNIRGWVTGINDYYVDPSLQPSVSPLPAALMKFGMQLNYDWGFEKNQYTGSIAGVKWTSFGDNEKRTFGYGYDRSNRLLYADFNQLFGTTWAKNDPANSNYTINFSVLMGNGVDPATAYDENGNIRAMKQYGLKLNNSSLIDDLTYNYSYNGSLNTNKLLNVIDAANDPATRLGDFRTSSLHPQQNKTISTADYSYDVNGNLTKDLNKDIGNNSLDGIEYNYLDLPYKVTFYNAQGLKGTITYIYDAAGTKLEKIVKEGSLPEKRTTYIEGNVYDNDRLQSLEHEEGRIRAIEVVVNNITERQFIYDYYLRDHLGNVRMVLTEEQQKDIYPVVSLENANAVELENTFYNVVQGNIVNKSEALNLPAYQNNNAGIPANNSAIVEQDLSTKLYRLKGDNAATKMGLGITLKVMAGDNITILGKSYWKTAAGTGVPGMPSPISLLDLLNDFVGTGVPGGKVVTGAQLNGLTEVVGGIAGLLSNQSQASNRPKAYINWILFDENFRPVISSSNSNSSVDPVGLEGQLTTHNRNTGEIKKNGYLYVYCSNESSVEVFFDNLQVIHEHGQLLEETHYYPFGLTMVAISSRAFGKLQGRAKFNENEIQNNEFSDGNGLETMDFNARMYDPQIGRFWQMDPLAEYMRRFSPYSFAYDNPVNYEDALGMLPGDTSALFGGQRPDLDPSDPTGETLAPVLVTAQRKKNGILGAIHMFLDIAGMVDQSGFSDLLNATLYLFEGDYKNAAISGLAALPLGDIAKGLKHLDEAEEAIETAIKYSDEVEEVVVKEVKAVKKPPCGCFIKGTLILADSGYVKIEDVKVGDIVIAYNDTTGQYSPKKVVRLFSYVRDSIYQVSIGHEKIKTTSDHPFFAFGKWVKAKDLHIGDSLQTFSGKKIAITGLKIIPGETKVHNFEVEDYHTYFVSDTNVLVHNSGVPCPYDLTRHGQAKHLQGEPGVYEHFFVKTGKKDMSYTGQAKNLGGSRPKKSLRRVMQQAKKQGYKYKGSNLTKLKGSGKKTLNDLERAKLKANGGPRGNTFNKNNIPK